ncbi:transglycosylase domain-containing protein [Salaquimonas pukyongi]|uniref:transglycosylase domain-containing protein n=1 Tax=Salaquimonas pukyongi TaxID=2712698 RepID=UPI00096BB826|nr:PBP1A family penicillin-binding protein [Salaquimonas pukyongi]
MRNPFEKNGRSKGRNRLLEIDSWIDSAMYRLFSGGSEFWENLVIFFQRFRATGFKRLLVEIADEGLTLGLAGLVVLLALALPAFDETSKNWRDKSDYSVIFLDRNGKEIGRRGVRQTDSGEIDTLPDHFIKAVLATEDRRFFEHYGIDFFGLGRALAENVRANSVVQGGSSITQQLAKNLFLTNERTIERKIKEAFLSLWLETNLEKNDILKLYLDRAYMGGGNFGITAAAEYYFEKSPKDLTLAEAAMLAGLYKAPSKYAPHINLPNARARANEVLTNMVQAGFMTEGQVVAARRKPATPIERNDIEQPGYFLDFAFEEVQDLARGLPDKTFYAKTTIDLDLQRAAEEAINNHLRQFGKEKGVSEAALVSIDRDGAVRAMVGGRDYGESQFNRATNSRRQPGSSFKPFVYATAVEELELNEKSRVVDGRICVSRNGRSWCPSNYSGSFRGRIDLQTAIVKSINTIPVKFYVGADGRRGIGGRKIVDTARRMGVTSELVMSPAMVLGSNGLTVLEMATGYGTFMTGGYKLDRYAIVQLTNLQGEIVYDRRDQTPPRVRVLTERTAGVMNRMMAQIPEWGTARRAALDGIRAAGKTGTTNAYRDAWFVGFTGNYVTAVWMGNDNYRPTRRLTGGNLPAMTWKQYMTFAHQNIELQPIPYIENPLPGRSPEAIAEQNEDGLKPALRPKTLSQEAEDYLRALGRTLRQAKPVLRRDVVAAREQKRDATVLAGRVNGTRGDTTPKVAQ